jgi:hypothetical protein
MRGRSILLLLVFFVAGVFVGIWLYWSGSRHITGPREISYQVQNYPKANLAVYPGDKLTLVAPDGNSSGLQMNFVGYSPCKNGNNQSTCEVAQDANPGPYFFTCSSTPLGGYSCPDPGIQQSPTIPVNPTITYGGAVKVAFTSLFAPAPATPTAPPPRTVEKGSHPATSAVTAYVSCQNNTTVLQDLNGNSMTNITASKGQTIFWISSRDFVIDASKFPAGMCTNGVPPASGLEEAQCDVGLSGLENVPYTVTAQTTPACSALNATVSTK